MVRAALLVCTTCGGNARLVGPTTRRAQHRVHRAAAGTAANPIKIVAIQANTWRRNWLESMGTPLQVPIFFTGRGRRRRRTYYPESFSNSKPFEWLTKRDGKVD